MTIWSLDSHVQIYGLMADADAHLVFDDRSHEGGEPPRGQPCPDGGMHNVECCK